MRGVAEEDCDGRRKDMLDNISGYPLNVSRQVYSRKRKVLLGWEKLVRRHKKRLPKRGSLFTIYLEKERNRGINNPQWLFSS
jgi:hypothetical protein